MRERIIEIIEGNQLDNKFLESKTGIKATTWGNLRTRKQRANEEHIKAIVDLYPEFAYWITTGKEIPEAGQISPRTAETHQKLKQA